MLDPQPEQLSGATEPVILVPVMAEDVIRRKRRFAAITIAIVLVVAGIAWHFYRRTVDPVEAQQAYTDGVRWFRSNRYDQAILNFSRTISLRPDFVDAYRMRGRAYMAMGKPDLAIPDFTKVSTMQPMDAAVLIDRGFAYMDKKDAEHAMMDASSAIALDDKLSGAYNLRATVERSRGNREKAIEDFTRAVELEPSLDNYFQRATTYQLLNDHKSALADFNQALILSPDQPHTFFARAQSRAALGDMQGAQEDIRTGRRIDGW